MLILGIETSCDDTSIAIVENGTKIISHTTSSQIKIHNKTGGVVPEIAAREHVRTILPVYEETLKKAKIEIEKIDAIAITKGPGLVSSLIIGTTMASTLALIKNKPIIPVHHIEGHLYSNWLDRQEKDFKFPIIILTASGGHNDLILMRNHGEYEKIGYTLDDASGEAFDKVARMLNLSYPGGPSISKEAKKGDSKEFNLPRSYLGKSFNFSFSGLKSEVLRIIQKEIEKNKTLSKDFVQNLSASFQESVVDILSTKLINSALQYNVKEIHIAGGVSANNLLRETVEKKGKAKGFSVKFPKNIKYSTDNGAMIASCGYFRYKKDYKKYQKWVNILPDPNLSFTK